MVVSVTVYPFQNTWFAMLKRKLCVECVTVVLGFFLRIQGGENPNTNPKLPSFFQPPPL